MLMSVVLDGRVRELDRLVDNAADEAADFGRRRVGDAVIDDRRNLSGVCGRWYLVVLDLHRFFIAISGTVVNHDGNDGTAPGSWVWSAGAVPKRRRLVMQFVTRPCCLGLLPFGDLAGSVCLLLLSVLMTLLIGLILPGLLVKWVAFLGHSTLACWWCGSWGWWYLLC